MNRRSRFRMPSRWLALACSGFVLLVAGVGTAKPAAAVGPCCCFCGSGHCRVSVEKEDREVTEFQVQRETICIPPLRFPWECGPIRKCGKVRHVKKLTSEQRTVPTCTYNWTAVHCCPSCRTSIITDHRGESPQGAPESDEQTPVADSSPLAAVLREQTPDADGWVHVTNAVNGPLDHQQGMIDLPSPVHIADPPGPRH